MKKFFYAPHLISRARFSIIAMATIGFAGLVGDAAFAQRNAEKIQTHDSAKTLQVTESSVPRRVALIIGNSNYQKLRRLANPGNDARLIEKSLRELGFTDIVGGASAGLDVTTGDMLVLLEEFTKLSAGAEMSVIYFAGHGLVSKVSNEQYLTGLEAGFDERKLPIEALSLSTLMDKLSQFGAEKNFVFLDACREPARGGGMRSVTPRRDAANTVILYATAADNVAADASSGFAGNSPFTRALAEELVVPNQEWSVLQRAIINRVARDTNDLQEPKAYGGFRTAVHFKITVEPSKDLLELEFWQSAKFQNSKVAYEAYLSKYPQGAFTELAKASVAALTARVPQTVVASVGSVGQGVRVDSAVEIEQTFWNAIKDSQDPKDFEDYVRRFSAGKFAAIAERQMRVLGANNALAISSLKGTLNWFFQPFTSTGGLSRLNGRLSLKESNGDYTLTLVTGGTYWDNCNQNPLRAKVEILGDSFRITPVMPLQDCEKERYLIKVDGSGGFREIKQGDNWVPDGKARGLRRID
jgi:Caspase domain